MLDAATEDEKDLIQSSSIPASETRKPPIANSRHRLQARTINVHDNQSTAWTVKDREQRPIDLLRSDAA